MNKTTFIMKIKIENKPKLKTIKKTDPKTPQKERKNRKRIDKQKIKQRRPPEHHKISPQQLFTKLNPLVKKSINNSTTLESRLKQQKIFDKEIISKMLFSRSVNIFKNTILNLLINFFIPFKLLIIFLFDSFEAFIIILIIFCKIFLIF